MGAFWQPQPGPQVKAVTCPVDFVFFGGSRGGGKSDALIGRQLHGAEKYGDHWNGLIVRRKYKDFIEMRSRIDGMIRAGLPAVRIGGEAQPNYVRFENGARWVMVAIHRLDLVDDFVGHQYTEISLDECTTFPFFTNMVDRLKGSSRSPHGVPCHMFGTGNPGGSGHMQVKDYFQLGSQYGSNPETVIYDENGESKIFIPSFLKDNRILCENDPKYVNRLMSIRDPALRKAWLDGDWDAYIGQAFEIRDGIHIIDDIWPIPSNAPMFTTFDWGFGAPFSWAWWWIDADGCAYRCAEWYGWNGTPQEGLRLEDSKVAEGVLERQQKMGFSERAITHLASPDCFSKKPDYRGGGQGPSTAEVFAAKGLYLIPADHTRETKIRQFRERLRYEVDETGKVTHPPMMRIYRSCKQFIRTVPSLSVDDDNPEDIDTEQEDHAYDDACEIGMARPIAMDRSKERRTIAAIHIDAVTNAVQQPELEFMEDMDKVARAWERDAMGSDVSPDDIPKEFVISTM